MLTSLAVPFYLSYAALVLLVLFQGFVLLGLVRIVSQMQTAVSGVDPIAAAAREMNGREVPRFQATATSGRIIDSAVIGERGAVLLFVSPDCSACTASLNAIDSLRGKKGEVVVVCRGPAEECDRLIAMHELDIPIVIDTDRTVSELFKIRAVPTAVILDENHIESYGSPFSNGQLTQVRLDELPQVEAV